MPSYFKLFFSSMFCLTILGCELIDFPVSVNPNDNDVVTYDLNLSSSDFYEMNLDIDSNGTVDFILFETQWGPSNQYKIWLEGNNENNHIITQFVFDPCGSQLISIAPSPLNNGFLVNASTFGNYFVSCDFGISIPWCNNGSRLVPINKEFYVGIRFVNDGDLHYGWLKVIANFSNPNSVYPDDVIVLKTSYNTTPGASLKIN